MTKKLYIAADVKTATVHNSMNRDGSWTAQSRIIHAVTCGATTMKEIAARTGYSVAKATYHAKKLARAGKLAMAKLTNNGRKVLAVGLVPVAKAA